MVLAIIHVVVLQLTFTGLVANRTINRMIDENKFEHRRLRRFRFRAGGFHHHAFGHFRITARFATSASCRFPRDTYGNCRKCSDRVIAVVRDFDIQAFRCLNQIEPIFGTVIFWPSISSCWHDFLEVSSVDLSLPIFYFLLLTTELLTTSLRCMLTCRRASFAILS